VWAFAGQLGRAERGSGGKTPGHCVTLKRLDGLQGPVGVLLGLPQAPYDLPYHAVGAYHERHLREEASPFRAERI